MFNQYSLMSVFVFNLLTLKMHVCSKHFSFLPHLYFVGSGKLLLFWEQSLLLAKDPFLCACFVDVNFLCHDLLSHTGHTYVSLICFSSWVRYFICLIVSFLWWSHHTQFAIHRIQHNLLNPTITMTSTFQYHISASIFPSCWSNSTVMYFFWDINYQKKIYF
jgi:hypothetical protein